MVRSIRHWCLATQVAEESTSVHNNRGRYLSPSLWGRRIFDDDKGWDPYLEDPATLWLLHWLLVSDAERATTWFYAFNVLPTVDFTKERLAEELASIAAEFGWNRVAVSTLKRDVDCFVRTYVPSQTAATASLPEDTFDCPLGELELINDLSDRRTYRFNVGPKPSLSDAVLTFAVLTFFRRQDGGRRTIPFEALAYAPGSPGRVFKLDEEALLSFLLRLEDVTNGAMSYDDTVGLRQVYWRRDDIEGTDLLAAHYGATGRRYRGREVL